MSTYIDGWKVKKLGDLGTFLRGKGIAKKDTTEKGIPCIRYGEIYTHHNYYIKDFYSYINQETADKSTKIQKNDILFAGSGETIEDIGKSVAFLHDEEAYAGGDIIILRTKNVNSLYLAYALNNGRLAIERAKLGQGHSIVHIYPKELKSLTIQLPPVVEQDKISSILSTWDKAIELKEKLIEQKKEQKKGLMQKLLTGEVRLPGVEKGWDEIILGDFLQEYKEKSTIPNQYPILTSSRIGLMLQSEYYANRQVTTNNNVGYHIIPRDYITYRSRSDDGKFTFNKNTIIDYGIISYFYPVFKFKDDVCGDFMLALLNFTIEKKAYSFVEGTAQKVLSLRKLGTFKYFIPNIEEQKAIAQILLTADEEIELLDRKVHVLKQQKKGLMQLLLTGKVRVKV